MKLKTAKIIVETFEDTNRRWERALKGKIVTHSNEEIISSYEGQYRLAGYMLRNLSDRVQVNNRGGRTTVSFHFDH